MVAPWRRAECHMVKTALLKVIHMVRARWEEKAKGLIRAQSDGLIGVTEWSQDEPCAVRQHQNHTSFTYHVKWKILKSKPAQSGVKSVLELVRGWELVALLPLAWWEAKTDHSCRSYLNIYFSKQNLCDGASSSWGSLAEHQLLRLGQSHVHPFSSWYPRMKKYICSLLSQKSQQYCSHTGSSNTREQIFLLKTAGYLLN